MTPPPESFVLFRRRGRVLAAAAPVPWPAELCIDGRRFAAVPDAADFMHFWDELLTPAGAVAGFVFNLHAADPLAGSPLLRAAGSVLTDFGPGGVEWRVGLADGPAAVECVQGFGSVLLRAADDPAESALWLANYSGRVPAFPLAGGVTGGRSLMEGLG